ncbi:MAG: aminotransferase class V-fold PLP-dependent enzyme [Bacteroidetes bacterium]|nr:aminotransferase class V-fold PLP-dependent enzyme [Bacteroidota bacterium]
MSRNIYFTPGPSELYFTVEDHIKQALKEQFPSQSHRGNSFKKCFQSTVENLRELLNVPSNYHILFTSSATEIWERIIQNCVEHQSVHLVNGAFSQRFYQTSVDLGKDSEKIACAEGSCASWKDIDPEHANELIAFTHNETSTGAAQPIEDIYAAREKFPDALIAVDVVSSIPYVNLDLDRVDTIYFSVQKSFGLPAGLGVWLVNDRCMEKANALQQKGLKLGTYHSLPSLVKQAGSYQTPETPNMLGIYLLDKVSRDMLQKGLDQIRKETEYKSTLLYYTIEEHASFKPFVKNSKFRSQTVVVAETEIDSQEVVEQLSSKGLIVGKGYGKFKEQHIRIANFATHSKEQIEMLVDQLNRIG